MENEKNELTLFSGVKQNVYCSKLVKTEEEKKISEAIELLRKTKPELLAEQTK